MKNKEFILFDFDGTLFDSQIGIKKAVQFALAKEGIEENDHDKLQSFIGPPLHYSFETHYGFSKEKVEELIVNLRKYYGSEGYMQTELYDGIKDLLVSLKKENKILSIATAKPTLYAENILKEFDLTHFFDSIQGSLLKGELFPKDRVIASVMKDLNLYDAEDAVMIGDTIYDIKGAQFHNMDTIAVNYGYGKLKDLKDAKANLIVETVAELRAFLI